MSVFKAVQAGIEEGRKKLKYNEPINPEMMPRSYMPESNVMSLAPYMAKGLINDVARYGKQAFTGEVSDRELLPQQPLTGDAKAVADAFGSGVGKALNYQVPTLHGSRSVMDDINMVVDAYQGARPGIVDALGEPSVNRVEGAGLLGSMFIPAKVPKTRQGVGRSKERVGTTGQYVGGPSGIDSEAKLAQMYADYIDDVELGVAGRDWYKDSSNFIDAVAPEGKRQAIADITGVTSQGTNVDSNLGFAIKGINQRAAGLPVNTGRFPNNQSPLIEQALDNVRENLGPKRQPFADNLSVS